MAVLAVMRCQMCGAKKWVPARSKSKGGAKDLEDFAKNFLNKDSLSFYRMHDCEDGKMGIMRLIGAETAKEEGR